jgi:hypothetical protein
MRGLAAIAAVMASTMRWGRRFPVTEVDSDPGSALTRYDSGTHTAHVDLAAQARIVA